VVVEGTGYPAVFNIERDKSQAARRRRMRRRARAAAAAATAATPVTLMHIIIIIGPEAQENPNGGGKLV